MTKLKPSTKAAIASTLVITSTVAIAYAVPKLVNEKSVSTENQLKLDIERVDSDTVKVAIDNVQDIPKAIQFSIKLEGAKLKDGEKSIKDLIKDEVQNRLDNGEYNVKSNNVLTDYTYNKEENTIDVLITAENSLPKTGNKIDILELDVKGELAETKTYKVVPNRTDEYKYVSNTNKEYNNLGVTHDNQDIVISAAPTISSDERTINIVEGENLDLTLEALEDKIGLKIEHEEGNNDLTLEVKRGKNIIDEFTENTPGIYELDLIAVKDGTIKSDPLTIQVNVSLDKITEPPTITMDEKDLTDITIDGGSIFKPLEGVKAVDKKGRDVEVNVEIDKSLDLDPEEDTTYTLTYTATDIYNNTAKEEITLTVIANKAPVIQGAKNQAISVGSEFDPNAGVTVVDEDKDIELKVESNVNTNIPGEYKVSYSATDSKGKTGRAQIKVTVNPKASVMNKVPTITAEDKTIMLGDKFDPLAGVSANDAEDGDLTTSIKIVEDNVDTSKAGEYTVTYEVKDSKGATAKKTVTITVKIRLAESITINNKSDNKMYIDNTKTITAAINEEAHIKDIKWIVSDEEIASLEVVDNKAQIVAKSEGKVTITASTTDGSEKSDSMTIDIVDFKNDSEIPSFIRDVIDTDVLLPIIDKDSSNTQFEVKDVTVDKLDVFLDSLDKLSMELVSIREENEFTIYKIKVTRSAKLFRSAQEYYFEIKVSNKLTNASEINDILSKVQNRKPVIIVPSNQMITVGDSFDPLDGVTAHDKDGVDITSNIKVEGKVDTSKAGEYKLTYIVEDAQGRKSSLTIIVTVNEKEETPDQEGTEQPDQPGDTEQEDTEQEDTEQPNQPGDAEQEDTEQPGQPGDAEQEDTEQPGQSGDTEQPGNNVPVIKVTSSIDTITVGDKFDPLAGVSAYDKEDGDLTSAIKVIGSVDTSKAGEYKLTYSVEDKDGNITRFTRVIVVKEADKLIDENSDAPQTGDNGMLGHLGIFTMSLGGLLLIRKKKNE